MYWWMTRVHRVWQVTMALAGVVMGAALAPYWWSMGQWWVAVIGLVCVAVACWRRRRMLLLFALVGGLLIGLARGGAEYADTTMYRPYVDRVLTVTGTVQGDVSMAARGKSAVTLRDVRIGDHALPGAVWVSIDDPGQLRRSDTVSMRGKLTKGFGTMQATMYEARIVDVQREAASDVGLAARDGFAAAVRRGMHGAAADLGIGYLLGQKSSLPAHLVEALQITGLTHIVVASGYNLTVLVRLARRLFAKRSRYLSVLASLLMIAGFIAMSGASPSMTRAGLVSGIAILAWYVGRRPHPVVLLVLVAAATVLVQPSYAWGDLGWLLSFGAFAGVMLLAPVVTGYLFGGAKAPFVVQLLIETVAAQVMTAPIIMAAFGQLSIIAPIANVLVLPLVPLAMLLVAIAGVGGIVVPQLAPIVAWPAQVLCDMQIWIINQAAQVDWAAVKWPLGAVGIVIWYAVLVAGWWWLWRRSKVRLRDASIVE